MKDAMRSRMATMWFWSLKKWRRPYRSGMSVSQPEIIEHKPAEADDEKKASLLRFCNVENIANKSRRLSIRAVRNGTEKSKASWVMHTK
jgi:hypothetical protein